MRNLSIDIESFSSADLKKCGVFRYAEAPDFEILLFAYAADDKPVQVVDLASGEQIPDDVLSALTDPNVTKWAWNASFERTCLSRYLDVQLDPASWRCTMVWAATLGLPLSLEQAGAVLGLEQQKLKEGRDLIRYFCQPCKSTLANGARERNLPKHAPEKWAQFKAYNVRDVEVERAIQQRLSKYPVPEVEWENYVLDQRINDRGIALDMDLVHQAICCDEQFRQQHLNTARTLTGLESPNSTRQLKAWLERNGLTVESLSKAAVDELLSEAEGLSREMLLLRRELAKSSVKKYAAMQNAVCCDGRARGLLQFYGANRTGRFASKLIQAQNLPANHLPDLAHARALVRGGVFDAIELLYDSVPVVLSELIRTAFVPKAGCRFLVADFSAIEARVIAWLAGEKWRLDVFNSHGRIYEASASQMFHVPIEQITKGSPMRQKGKVAELACIAEHSLVLTHIGLVPIEEVTTSHLLWDGVEWVRHDGVVFKGEREVVAYDGLTATPDHPVWIEGGDEPIKLQDAAIQHAKLVHVGACEAAYLCGNIMPVYDILNAGPRHRFTVSGRLVHNCGYGGSVGALKNMGALAMGVKEDELQGLINNWRAANPAIVRLWWDLDAAAIEAVRERTISQTNGIRFIYESGILFIQLPSGRRLAYVKPRIQKNRFDRDDLSYEGVGEAKKWMRIETYGPKLVENCLAAGTLVVTDCGLIPIEHIEPDMRLWDGVDWVTHDGLLDQGIHETVRIGAIRMTPDHKILTGRGWRISAASEGYNWATVSLPNGYRACSQQSYEEPPMAGALRLRLREDNGHKGSDAQQVVRVQAGGTDRRCADPARHVASPGVRSLALYETALRGSESSRLSQLWRAWYQSMLTMGAQLRAVLGGHGANLRSGAGFGSHGQQQGIRAGELPLGEPEGQLSESPCEQRGGHTTRQDVCIGVGGADRDRCDDATVSDQSRLADSIAVRTTGLQERVYDIRNCGPRRRFAVWDVEEGKARIVSNCTQAIARDLLTDAMRRIDAAGYKIVMHCHDEVVVEATPDQSLDKLCALMAEQPEWAKGLPLRADGYECEFYQKS